MNIFEIFNTVVLVIPIFHYLIIISPLENNRFVIQKLSFNLTCNLETKLLTEYVQYHK